MATRWVKSENAFGSEEDTLQVDGEPVASVRHPNPRAMFPMFHYQCLRCSDNLGSVCSLSTMKRKARRHYDEVHAV